MRHSLLEKYTSHFIWKVAWERELETKQNCNILTSTLMAISVSFLLSRVVQPEAWGPSLLGAGFLYRILSPTDLVSRLVSKLTDFLSSPSYIIVQSPTQSLEWHIWTSSSGNNCLFRCISLWLYRGILTLSLIVSQVRPRQWNMQLPRLWNGMFGWVEGQYTTIAKNR